MPNYQEPGLSDLKLKISELELTIHELMMRIENLVLERKYLAWINN